MFIESYSNNIHFFKSRKEKGSENKSISENTKLNAEIKILGSGAAIVIINNVATKHQLSWTYSRLDLSLSDLVTELGQTGLIIGF